jgi:hypothetical protein
LISLAVSVTEKWSACSSYILNDSTASNGLDLDIKFQPAFQIIQKRDISEKNQGCLRHRSESTGFMIIFNLI